MVATCVCVMCLLISLLNGLRNARAYIWSHTCHHAISTFYNCLSTNFVFRDIVFILCMWYLVFIFKYNTYKAIDTIQIYLIDRIYLYTTFTYKHVNTKIFGHTDYLFYHRWTHFPLGCCNIKLAVLWIHFRAINLVIKPLCIRVTTISFKNLSLPIFSHTYINTYQRDIERN